MKSAMPKLHEELLLSIHLSNATESLKMRRRMEKQTICMGENKGADQLRSICEADQRFVFDTRIVQFLCFLNLISNL